MSQPILIADSFDKGFRSDIPRDQLPPGVAFRMKDWIPNEGVTARRRGAFTHASRDLQEVANPGSQNIGLRYALWAPFVNDSFLMASSGWGDIFRVAEFDGNDGSAIGPNVNAPFGLTWHRDKVIMLGSPVQKITQTVAGVPGYSIANLGGSPPSSRYGSSWGDYFVLANLLTGVPSDAAIVRWSSPGNPESWPALSTYTAPEDVLGLVTRGNTHYLFGPRGVHLLIGDTPPPGGNFTARPYYFNQGIFDSRSIQVYGSDVIWANQAGVWRTDGTSQPVNLCLEGGIFRYWRAATKGLVAPSVTGMALTAGLFRGYYVVTILTRDTAYPYASRFKTLLCDLERVIWFEFQGVEALHYAQRVPSPGSGAMGTGQMTGEEELFFVSSSHMTVEKLSPCWEPSSANAIDPWSTNTPKASLETGFIKLTSNAQKRFRRAFITRDIRPYTPAASVRATYSVSSTGAGTSLSINNSSFKPQVGELVLVTVGSGDDNCTDVTMTGGFTKLGQQIVPNGHIHSIWGKIADAADASGVTTWTADFTGAAANHERGGHVNIIQNAPSTLPTVLAGVDQDSQNSPHESPVIAMSGPGLALSFLMLDDSSDTMTGFSTTSSLTNDVLRSINVVPKLAWATRQTTQGVVDRFKHTCSLLPSTVKAVMTQFVVIIEQPTLQVSSVVVPNEDATYNTGRGLPGTSKMTRRAVRLDQRGQGIALKIEQGGKLDADISLDAVELDGHSLEGST